jgi:hypothetical protein
MYTLFEEGLAGLRHGVKHGATPPVQEPVAGGGQ